MNMNEIEWSYEPSKTVSFCAGNMFGFVVSSGMMIGNVMFKWRVEATIYSTEVLNPPSYPSKEVSSLNILITWYFNTFTNVYEYLVYGGSRCAIDFVKSWCLSHVHITPWRYSKSGTPRRWDSEKPGKCKVIHSKSNFANILETRISFFLGVTIP